jgi:hypothetical protein
MSDLFKRFSVAYLAGALGGVALALVFWLFGHWGVFKPFSLAALGEAFTWSNLAPMILTGSLWALLIVPVAAVLKLKGAAFGLILSLIPSIYLLLVQYPAEHHGLSPFTQSPHRAILILVAYAAWGLVAGTIYGSQYK